MEAPKTLQEAIIYFSDFENCRQFIVALRWPDLKVRCPHCGSDKVTYLASAKLYKCYGKHEKAKVFLEGRNHHGGFRHSAWTSGLPRCG